MYLFIYFLIIFSYHLSSGTIHQIYGDRPYPLLTWFAGPLDCMDSYSSQIYCWIQRGRVWNFHIPTTSASESESPNGLWKRKNESFVSEMSHTDHGTGQTDDPPWIFHSIYDMISRNLPLQGIARSSLFICSNRYKKYIWSLLWIAFADLSYVTAVDWKGGGGEEQEYDVVSSAQQKIRFHLWRSLINQ